MMRKFFEEKLSELQSVLEEKEKERDQLRHDLELAEKRNGASPEITALLQQKQEQIDVLKRLESNYKRQAITSLRSQDSDRLTLLQKDVVSMKKRKADLQKELASEKRHHIQEMGKLNKMMLRKDREINKFQKFANLQAKEMEKANAISKNRLEELTQLKRAIRNYKRGVGLDPVIVGRRQVRLHGEHRNAAGSEIGDCTVPPFVVDKIRDYFDSKVASVVRQAKTKIHWTCKFNLKTKWSGRSHNDSNGWNFPPLKRVRNDETVVKATYLTINLQNYAQVSYKSLSCDFLFFPYVSNVDCGVSRIQTRDFKKHGCKRFVWNGCSRASKGHILGESCFVT
jgi:hypothetical protein